eukprot:TRINITY_DN4556_c0_g1_i1.p1 TRINITY_DN4556_c0_g1~~TRINITY_DN4556_c0_g1_i1.p1  ORF type:complete len:75 (-),score=12.11 TRINITY_DN4556_c0_g1_i1:217-441(-)
MMAGVRLPTDDLTIAQAAVQQIWEELDCYVVVFEWSGKIWTRLSVQIYNEQADIIVVGSRMLQIINQLEENESN